MAEKLRTYNDLLKLIQDSEREYDLALIDKAYQLAYQMHGDQKRLSGAPYISHPIAVPIPPGKNSRRKTCGKC